jgi:hypothetical protein
MQKLTNNNPVPMSGCRHRVEEEEQLENEPANYKEIPIAGISSRSTHPVRRRVSESILFDLAS